MYTIKDLSEGKVAVTNDGTLEELNLVLKMAFKDARASSGSFIFYSKSSSFSDDWEVRKDLSLPTQSVKDFLTVPEKWYVRITDENRQILSGWGGKIVQDYYESITSNKQYILRGQLPDYQEIPFKLFELKILNKMDYTITADQMKSLYEVVNYCPKWRDIIFNLYGRQMLDNQVCIVKQDLIDQARKEANDAQLCLINETFKPKFKVGDWVVVTGTDSYDYGMSSGEEKPVVGNVYKIKYSSESSLELKGQTGFIYIRAEDLRFATPKEVERSQIKDGDLVWVKDKGHVSWTVRKAKGSFSEQGIKTYDMIGLIQTWDQYKKASQAVVDEYNSLNKE